MISIPLALIFWHLPFFRAFSVFRVKDPLFDLALWRSTLVASCQLILLDCDRFHLNDRARMCSDVQCGGALLVSRKPRKSSSESFGGFRRRSAQWYSRY